MQTRRTGWRDTRFAAFDKPERFYGRERPAATVATVGIAALCAIGLAMAGTFTSSTPEGEQGSRDDTGRQTSRFLAALKQYRPSAEKPVRTGISPDGLPATLRFDHPDSARHHRVNFQCDGPGQAATTTVETDGTRREHAFQHCAQGIASIALNEATVVVIELSDDRTRILWALVEDTKKK
ncbi:hypothetical protein [Streptomyces sp. NPDC006134]|uniref:hypothetical protein n=1 Tax=Streptomyces sp. NPDC006134 TaxID=3154467 RepID=UPI0033FBD9DC